jgi:signal transduction histidine kinase
MAWQMAVTEERNRLAQEIHDTLAQAFAGILFQADTLKFSLGVHTEQGKGALERIQELARSGMDEARRAVRALRPRALEGSTLPDALERAAKCLSSDHNLSCEFRQLGRAWRLSAQVEDELFRIAQEAMTNVKKHAQARWALVNLEFKAGQVILTVRDNGVGFAATGVPVGNRGHGLAIMRERARRIGGWLDIESPVNGGAAIRVPVPLVEAAKRSGKAGGLRSA